MSRIAKKILPIRGVQIVQEGELLKFSGTLGKMQLKLHPEILVNINSHEHHISVGGDAVSALRGTFVKLIDNAIIGVTKGFEKKVKLVGVGYKGSTDGKIIKLSIGLSHDVIINIPEGIKVVFPNIANIIITSCNKELLGMFVDKLCKSKKYNVYNGTGVLETNKFYRRKETKKK
jgi:large subunit ribosomal protein L6